jgi:hypothetical protein
VLLGVHRQSEEQVRIGQLVERREVEPAPKAVIVRRQLSRSASRHLTAHATGDSRRFESATDVAKPPDLAVERCAEALGERILPV